MEAPIRSVEAFCYRLPLATAVVTSFGRMLDRPAVFVRITDEEGREGWGETWCNFPSVGAEHRARLIGDVARPLLFGRDLGAPGTLFQRLAAATEVLALQSGEPGPLAQVAAGLDIAHWDLAARRAGQPLWRALGGVDPTIRVYASGINPTGAADMAARALARGHRAFKLKIGFDIDRDTANLRAIREVVGAMSLAADANQAWTASQAAQRIEALSAFDLAWLEEPLRADVPWDAWKPLQGGPPLAGGENIAGEKAFAEAIDAGVLDVIQPDVAKWGGLSLCRSVAQTALRAGRQFFPHYLGGGIGLLASAHLLAAVGGNGMLEIDANENPLRETCCGPLAKVTDGTATLSEAPGLGTAPDLDHLEQWRTF